MSAENRRTAYYELLVIGTEKAGLDVALAAARAGRRVGLVVPPESSQTDSLPPFSLQGVSPHCVGRAVRRLLCGAKQADAGSGPLSADDSSESVSDEGLLSRLRQMVTESLQNEARYLAGQLQRMHVELVPGIPQFVAPHRVRVTNGEKCRPVDAERIVIATGTTAVHSRAFPIDNRRIFDADHVLNLPRLPRRLVVVGEGWAGIQYATLFARLGSAVTLFTDCSRLNALCDEEALQRLWETARNDGVEVRDGQRVLGVDNGRSDEEGGLSLRLDDGTLLQAEGLLYDGGRRGNTGTLNVAAAGLETDEAGRFWCHERFGTWQPHIFAVGSVVGYPHVGELICDWEDAAGFILGDTSEAGEMPSAGMWRCGLATFPAVSMVGRTEAELLSQGVLYETGTAEWNEPESGGVSSAVSSSARGLLKLLFERSGGRLLGVHAVGEHAPQLGQLGQTMMALKATRESLRTSLFSDPVLAEPFLSAARQAAENQRWRMPVRPRLSLYCPADCPGEEQEEIASFREIVAGDERAAEPAVVGTGYSG